MKEKDLRTIINRAAQLQEIRERGEGKQQLLSDGTGSQTTDQDEYSLDVIKEAASEIGISHDEIQIAAAEQQSPRYKPVAESLVTRAISALGSDQRVIRISFTLACPPDQAASIVRTTVEDKPYRLSLLNLFGEETTRDGVLIFRTTGYDNLDMSTDSQGFIVKMMTLDVRQILMTIRPVAENEAKSSITLVAPLDYALAANYKVDVGISLGVGAAALVLGAIFLPFPPLAAWSSAAGLSLGSSWLSRVGYRWSYQRALKKGKAALEEMVASIQTAGKINCLPKARAI